MILFLVVCTFVGFILTLIAFIYFKAIRPQKRLYDIFIAQGIPGEPFVPIFGQLFDIIRASKQNKRLEYFNELAQKHVYHFLIGQGPLIRFMVLEPELLADVFGRSKAENYQKTSF